MSEFAIGQKIVCVCDDWKNAFFGSVRETGERYPGLVGQVPDHSTFSKNRHGRFRQSDLLRCVFETVLQRQDRIFGSDRIIVRLAKGCRLAFQRTTSPRPQAHPGTAPTLICRS